MLVGVKMITSYQDLEVRISLTNAFSVLSSRRILVVNRCIFVGLIGSDCNHIRTVIFSCLTKTDIAIGLAMFCEQRSFGTPRTVHHTKSCLKLSFYRSIRIYRVDFEKI